VLHDELPALSVALMQSPWRPEPKSTAFLLRYLPYYYYYYYYYSSSSSDHPLLLLLLLLLTTLLISPPLFHPQLCSRGMKEKVPLWYVTIMQ